MACWFLGRAKAGESEGKTRALVLGHFVCDQKGRGVIFHVFHSFLLLFWVCLLVFPEWLDCPSFHFIEPFLPYPFAPSRESLPSIN